jgi:hypothetical protein
MKRSSPLKRSRGLTRKRKAPRRQRAGRDPAYLAFVRTHDCLVCGKSGPSHPHHATGERMAGGPKGGSMKAGDETCVSLCFGCHNAWHSLGHFVDMTREASISLMERTRVALSAEWERLRAAEGTGR